MRLGFARGSGGSVMLLLALAALVPMLLAATFVQYHRARRDEDARLASEARQQGAAVAQGLERARSLAQILAFNPAFRHVYEDPGSVREHVLRQSTAVREANTALAQLETLFPGQIGEACFIDRNGSESARAVKGVVAPISQLSTTERGTIFFKPTFALEPGEVFQSRAYVSPDTKEWVIANASPIPRIHGEKRAFVHFELTLESLRRTLETAADAGLAFQIVDRRSQRILVDSRYVQRPNAPLAPKPVPHTHPKGYTEPKGPHVYLPPGRRAGHLTEGRFRAAFDDVAVGEHNENRWVVVAQSTRPRPTWSSSQTAWQLGILIAVLTMFPLALLNWLRAQGDLTEAATTDPLTGLGNRRRLAGTLERRLAHATPDRPLLLALYDLDGFKLYNDTYGHPAGDTLLKRLAENLATSLNGQADVFRMGGDEFCVVARLERAGDAFQLADTGVEALREHGDGFTVEASVGTVLLPEDAQTHEDALRLADQRMYAQKSFSRMSASRQTTDVLTRLLAERDADLGVHGSSVGDLAEQTALRMGASREDAEQIRRAGTLHDVGKLAIPESILSKPTALTEDEWAFIVTHTVVGERIIASAPALAGVARLVRSSHEAWDGSGYPDGLEGVEVPLGARIIAVCDAYEAMISERPYRPALPEEEALAELRRCAGTQFDPSVVAAFCAIVAARRRRQATAFRAPVR